MARPPAARSRVLDAAARVLTEEAAATFTLDAVAAVAGVSKGGLMYHFRSKEALLEALVTREVDAFDRVLAQAYASSVPGAFTRAYLESTLPAGPGAAPPPAIPPTTAAPTTAAPTTAAPTTGGVALTSALAAAVALDPRLLEPLRAAYRRWQARLEEDGVDAAAATVVRLAVDGWWLAALLGLTPPSPQVQARCRDLLERLAEPDPDQE